LYAVDLDTHRKTRQFSNGGVRGNGCESHDFHYVVMAAELYL
jgi:hypothetical protein